MLAYPRQISHTKMRTKVSSNTGQNYQLVKKSKSEEYRIAEISGELVIWKYKKIDFFLLKMEREILNGRSSESGQKWRFRKRRKLTQIVRRQHTFFGVPKAQHRRRDNKDLIRCG